MPKNSLWRSALAILMLVVMLLAAGCGGGGSDAGDGDSTPPKGEKEVIRLADLQWQTIWINNAIAKFIIENGYGYPVETVEVTSPIMQVSLVRGDLDAVLEIWSGNMMDWYTEVTESGKILDLGKVMDRTTQGWYVPAYVIHGDPERGIEPTAPDLRTVEDLKRYASLFRDPEEPSKGRIISCITGWDCAAVNRVKLYAYDLDELYNLQEPGTSGALDAAIAGAYQRGESFVTYYWEPTWLMGALDLVLLEEPPYTEACWNEVRRGTSGEVPLEEIGPEAGCAYADFPVVKGVHPSLKERAPEVVAFLEKMMIPTEDLNKISNYMEENKVEADRAAIWFFENYQDVWRSWLPDDVAEKVEQALVKAGANL